MQLKKIISNTDLSKIQEVSVSVQALQAKIDQAISSISIDQKMIQAQVLDQVRQAIKDCQSEIIETEIQSLLGAQQAQHLTWASTVWSADAFNQLVHKLSVRYELKNNQRTERNDPAKLAVNTSQIN
ncbi:hypothetical protein [Acinetobacter baumannii]|uniref:hypothetical protein n=1 Tax=Acinetobacter baumannii TaxID=470 RepID=UPI0029495E9A|nr:hypothetical protein [Acinetobacter baumannii]MDV5263239.1 hypothetical protein [Acinetobacter baumannii]